jgi:hypothetical protein
MTKLTHLIRRVHEGQRGQSIVEFALIVPLILIIFLAVADFARIYTTMMTVESAAREAADFGAWKSSYWQTSPVDNRTGTVDDMIERACIAARNLPDYEGPDHACVNPTLQYWLVEPDDIDPANFDLATLPAEPTGADACDIKDRPAGHPCWVIVSLHYDFHLISPMSIDFMGVHVGFPSTIPFDRTSVFAISDFDLDEGP